MIEQKIRAIGPRNQITLPASLMHQLGLHPGNMVKFLPQKGAILIKPVSVVEKEGYFTKEEWDKLGRLINNQNDRGEYTEYPTLDKALGHSRKRMK